MKKGEVFAPGIFIIAALLMIYTIGVIYNNQINSQNEAVGKLAIDAISSNIEYNTQVVLKSNNLNERMINFFERGASNKDSYKIISDGNNYRLWAKKTSTGLKTCYPNKQAILNNLAQYLQAESVTSEGNQIILDFGEFNNVKTVDGRVYDYEADFSRDILVKIDSGSEIDKAVEFFDRLSKCNLNGDCYNDLGGVKEIDNSYFFTYSLSKNIVLKGVVTLDEGNPLTEKFEC